MQSDIWHVDDPVMLANEGEYKGVLVYSLCSSITFVSFQTFRFRKVLHYESRVDLDFEKKFAYSFPVELINHSAIIPQWG